jgi:glucokinase
VPSVLAVDIGGTKIAAGVVRRDGTIVRGAVAPTDGGDGEELFANLVSLIEGLELAPADELVGCGIGCGGPMSAGGETVSPLNIPVWREFPLARRLAAAISLEVAIDNDAKALALGEWWRGAATGHRDFVAMVVSTGVGGGVVVDGRLLDGASGNAGHVGHVIVEPDGAECTCGALGCLEAEASGTAILRITGRPAQEATPELVERTGRLVGRGLGSVCTLLDVPLVVVAGSVALGFGDPFFAAAQAELDRVCRISFARGSRIVPAGLGSDGPLVGAAAVGWRGLGQEVWA